MDSLYDLDEIQSATDSPVQTVTEQQSHEISDVLVKDPTKQNKTTIIIISVVVGVIIIAVIATVIVLVTRPPTAEPTPTPSMNPFFPDIPTMIVNTLTNIPFDVNGTTLDQVTLYSQQGSNIGVLLSSMNNASQLVTLNVDTLVTESTFVLGTDIPNLFMSPYITSSGSAGGTLNVDDSKINLFDINISGSGISNVREASVPTDQLSFNPDLYWVSTSTLYSGSDPTNALTCSLVIDPEDLQVYKIKGWLQDGSNASIDSPGIPVGGVYDTILYASGQPFFATLLFDTADTIILDVFISDVTNSFRVVNIPVDVKGELVGGTANLDTTVLLTTFTDSLYLFTRDISAGTSTEFETNDHFFLPFEGVIRFSAVTDDASWFVINTTVGKLVFGQIMGGVFNREKLRIIDIANEPTSLINTNGPCGIGLSSDLNTLYIFQADNLHHAIVFIIPTSF